MTDDRLGAEVVDQAVELWGRRVTRSRSFADLRRMERAARVLRLHNRGIEVDKIAEREGLSPGQVAEDIRHALRGYIDEAAEDAVARHRAITEDVVQTNLAIMADVGAKDADRVRAGTAVIRALANEAKLLGINSPTRIEVGSAGTADDFAAVAASLIAQLGREVPPVLAAAANRSEIVEADPEPVDPDLGYPGGPDDEDFGGLPPWVDD